MAMKIVACILLFALIAVYAAPQYKNDQEKQKQKGGVAVDVQKERGQGTNVRIDGRQQVFKSNDGRTKAEVYGQWERTYGGQNNGQRNHKYGGRIEHSWK